MPDGMSSKRQFYGKYRGTVASPIDPLFKGRVQVLMTVGGAPVTVWAEACTPYAGPGVGFYAIPPTGSGVWIEFEEGDLEKPIWTGCWWREGDVSAMLSSDLTPPTPVTAPNTVVLRTLTTRLQLDMLTGTAVLESLLKPANPATPTQVKLSPAGIEITCSKNTLRVSPLGIVQM
jgi:Type VI secretion system/phage-baseplate injector OB domain